MQIWNAALRIQKQSAHVKQQKDSKFAQNSGKQLDEFAKGEQRNANAILLPFRYTLNIIIIYTIYIVLYKILVCAPIP